MGKLYAMGIERVRVRKVSGGEFSRTLTEPAGETDSPTGHKEIGFVSGLFSR